LPSPASSRADSAKVVDGSKGLSLFQVETHRADGAPNNIVIHKLKDKLGTKGVPTAELELRGTRARLVGELGRGVPHIATLFNLTRIHNATAAAAGMRRIIAAARDYAPRRTALGASLADNALHLQTIAEMEAHCRAAVLMLMDSVLLLGETEVPPNGDKARAEAAARTLRIATPLLKLFTAKQAMIVMSEGIEALGAHGYMEDSGIPRLLRDAQVLPIWEGTTNVLALDMLRVVSHDARAITDFMARAESRAAEKSRPALGAARTAIIKALGALATERRQDAGSGARSRHGAQRTLLRRADQRGGGGVARTHRRVCCRSLGQRSAAVVCARSRVAGRAPTQHRPAATRGVRHGRRWRQSQQRWQRS
jgi:hypothetical protein